MSTPTLRAGIARRDITPVPGTELFGYPTQRIGHEIADALHVTALVLQSGEHSAAILSLDLCVLDEAEIAAMRRAIAAESGLDASRITLCATHTHSGPVTIECWGWGEKNQDYLDTIRPRLAEAVLQAQRALQPVRVGFGRTHTDAGVNRREVTPAGEVKLGFNEWGACDRDLTVARFESEQGALATLVHLGAHPTARGVEPSVSRDWPGVMTDRIEQITGAPVLFVNGAFGDVAPRTNYKSATGDGAPAATEVGLRAAADALRARESIKEFREVALQTITRPFALPLAPLPAPAEVECKVREYSAVTATRGREACEKRHWNAVAAALAAARHGEPPATRRWQQTITRLGPLAIVPFAGEIFSEIALRVKRDSPFEYTLCAGTANGGHGYYVTREARARGGYEPWVAKAYGAFILADEIDDVLVRENVALLRALE